MNKEFPKIKTEFIDGKWVWKWIDEEPSNFRKLFYEMTDELVLTCAYIPTELDLKEWTKTTGCRIYKHSWTIPGTYVLVKIRCHDEINEYEAVHVDNSSEIEYYKEMIPIYIEYLNILKSGSNNVWW